MNNSYFLYSKDGLQIDVERFHICTWEFRNGNALVEFGCEVGSDSIGDRKELTICLFASWLSAQSKPSDMYPSLKKTESLRLIFNDSIKGTENLNKSSETEGINVEFVERKRLCVLPVNIKVENADNVAEFRFNLAAYQNLAKENRPNIYCRFSMEPKLDHISIRKNGIGKSTIIYDIKLNERRNIPQDRLSQLESKAFCSVKSCFCLNIVPNSYDLTFFDSAALKNVRTLESDPFNQYLGQKRVQDGELLVVFNKQPKLPDLATGQYSFFLKFAKERIGMSQFVAAILINLVAGILLLLGSLHTEGNAPYLSKFSKLSFEFWIAVGLVVLTFSIFVMPKVKSWLKAIWKTIKNKAKR